MATYWNMGEFCKLVESWTQCTEFQRGVCNQRQKKAMGNPAEHMWKR